MDFTFRRDFAVAAQKRKKTPAKDSGGPEGSQVTSPAGNPMLAALTDLNAYKSANGLSDAALLLLADTNGDHAVTNADIQPLLDLLAASGGGDVPSVPEPSSLALAAVSFAALCVFILRSRLATAIVASRLRLRVLRVNFFFDSPTDAFV